MTNKALSARTLVTIKYFTGQLKGPKVDGKFDVLKNGVGCQLQTMQVWSFFIGEFEYKIQFV